MSVYDRWHLSHPENHPGWNHEKPQHRLMPCKCGRGKNKLYPTGIHGQGRRWQVRWRDDDGNQAKKNFAERYGDDPERHAEAFDAKVGAELDSDTYIAPDRAKITLAEFAKDRGMRVSDGIGRSGCNSPASICAAMTSASCRYSGVPLSWSNSLMRGP